MNRTIQEGIIAMLTQSNLPPSFWGYALALFVCILNTSPTSTLSNSVPHDAFFGTKPDLSMLRTFGCTAYSFIQKKKRKNLQSHATKGIYLGFEDGYKGYKIYDPKKRTPSISHDVIFNEQEFPGLALKKMLIPTNLFLNFLDEPETSTGADLDDAPPPNPPLSPIVQTPTPAPQSIDEDENPKAQESNGPNLSERLHQGGVLKVMLQVRFCHCLLVARR